MVPQGEIEWTIGGKSSLVAGPGDVIFMGRDETYSVVTVGEESPIRVTISAPVN